MYRIGAGWTARDDRDGPFAPRPKIEYAAPAKRTADPDSPTSDGKLTGLQDGRAKLRLELPTPLSKKNKMEPAPVFEMSPTPPLQTPPSSVEGLPVKYRRHFVPSRPEERCDQSIAEPEQGRLTEDFLLKEESAETCAPFEPLSQTPPIATMAWGPLLRLQIPSFDLTSSLVPPEHVELQRSTTNESYEFAITNGSDPVIVVDLERAVEMVQKIGKVEIVDFGDAMKSLWD